MFEPVIETDAPKPGEPAEGQGKDDKVTIDRTQYESLQRELKEAKQSEQSWARIARNGNAPLAEETAVETEEELDGSAFLDDADIDIPADDTPEKVVADFSAKGAKALQERGFVTGKEARRIAVEAAAAVSKELIGRERTKLTTDAQLMNEFPELKDQNSELFKETAARFQKAVAIDKRSAKNPGALYLAAQAAKDSIEAKRAVRSRSDENELEDETDRRLRARSQDSRPSGRREIEDDEDMFGPEARNVAKLMGVSEAEFKASQKALGETTRRRR